METRASYIVVGIFVLTLFIGILGFTMWISRTAGEKGTFYDVSVEDAVSGISEGDSVTYNGVPIGTIYKIEIEPQDLKHIRVVVSIDHPELIREGAYATLEPKGITGQTELQIHGSDSHRPALKAKSGQRRPAIEFRRSQFQQVMASAPRILDGLASLVQDVSPLFKDENRQHFANILTHLDRFTDALGKHPQDVENLFITANKSFQSFDKTMADLAKLVSSHRAPLKKFTSTGLNEFSELMAQLKTLASKLNHISDKFSNSLLEGSDNGKEIE
jgi:phospholipid/cholesterol/gamma-HCH transport system substrate-binding protein